MHKYEEGRYYQPMKDPFNSPVKQFAHSYVYDCSADTFDSCYLFLTAS